MKKKHTFLILLILAAVLFTACEGDPLANIFGVWDEKTEPADTEPETTEPETTEPETTEPETTEPETTEPETTEPETTEPETTEPEPEPEVPVGVIDYLYDPVTSTLTISGTGAMANYMFSGGGSDAPWMPYRKYITKIVILPGVTSIGDFAFYGLNALTDISIPEGVTSIGNSAFCGCFSLSTVVLPYSLTTIGDGAFYYCSSLTSVNVHAGITSVGMEAFADCRALKSILIPSKTIRIYDGANTFPSGCTIYGYTGSTAQAYATKNNKLFVALDAPETAQPEETTSSGKDGSAELPPIPAD